MPDNFIKPVESGSLISTGIVCVTTDRYNELVSAEVKLKFVESMYRNDTKSYSYTDLLKNIFGPKGENEDAQ